MVGQIDRLVAVRSAGTVVRAELLDFKTDQVRDSDNVASLVERHRAQVESYREAVARLLRIDATRITAKVVYLERGVAVDL